MKDDPKRSIQRRSQLLAWLAGLVFAVLALGLGFEAASIRHADDPLASTSFALIYRLPFIFYLLAIWKLHKAFRLLAGGAIFDHVVPALLRSIGIALSTGAITTIFVTPLLLRMSFGPYSGGLANFDAAAIMLAIVGIMLTLLAGLLNQAVAINAELGEFV